MDRGVAEDLLEVWTGNLNIKLFDLGIWPFRAIVFGTVVGPRLKGGPDSEGRLAQICLLFDWTHHCAL